MDNVDALQKEWLCDFVKNLRGEAERVESRLSYLAIAMGEDINLAKDVSKELGRKEIEVANRRGRGGGRRRFGGGRGSSRGCHLETRSVEVQQTLSFSSRALEQPRSLEKGRGTSLNTFER